MTDDAIRRLRAYCRRARWSGTDLHDNGHGREARYLSPDLRRIVWNDVEVRAVLLKAADDRAAWNALVALVGHELGLPLLDVVSAVELEARTAAPTDIAPPRRAKTVGRRG
jgi:hypothetical protein